VKSVKKKLKDKAFARSVNRDDIYQGVEELGVTLDEHIQFVIDSLKPAQKEIGLGLVAQVGSVGQLHDEEQKREFNHAKQ
jgi:hypothetical protein